MKKQVIKSTAVVAGSTMLSRILGFFRDAVMANYFGTGPSFDGFIVAFRIPNLLRRFVAEGTLTICFVPVYTEYLEIHGKDAALKLAQKTLSFLLVILTALTLSGIMFSPRLVALFGYGFTDQTLISSTISLNRIMFPYIFMVSIVAFCMGYLNSHRSFFAPAVSPVLLNLGMIFGVLVLRNYFENGLWGLAFGVLMGGFLQVLLQLPFMIRHGFRMRISFDYKHPGIRKIGLMVLPAMMSGAVSQLNLLINTVLASMLPGGSVSYLYYADRLTEIVVGVFVVSIAGVALPELSRYASRKDMGNLRTAFVRAVTSSLFFSVPASVALMVSGHQIIEVLFMRGEFDIVSVSNTYRALFFASTGLFTLTFYKLLVPVFYSLQDTKTPFITATVALLINGLAGYTLMQTSLAHAGLALSSVISIMVQVVLLLVLLRRKMGRIGFRSIIKPALKLFFASAIMGVWLWFLQRYFLWGENTAAARKILQLLFMIASGGLIYIIICYLIRVDELKTVLNIIRSKMKRV